MDGIALNRPAFGKGQVILKGLFGILEFVQRTNETIPSVLSIGLLPSVDGRHFVAPSYSERNINGLG